MSPPLLLVAHGSRDPRSAATVRQLAAVVREQAGDVVVETAFLDLSEPSVPDALANLYARGHSTVVVVPLLLGAAFHARVDLPALITQATERNPGLAVSVTDVLGPDPLLQRLAAMRVAELGTGQVGVVLAGVGSSHAKANATVARIADSWRARGLFPQVAHAFATCDPSVQSAVARLRADGAAGVVIAPWFLAPGLLLDRVAKQARQTADGVAIAEPLGAHPWVAHVVLARYAASVPVTVAA